MAPFCFSLKWKKLFQDEEWSVMKVGTILESAAFSKNMLWIVCWFCCILGINLRHSNCIDWDLTRCILVLVEIEYFYFYFNIYILRYVWKVQMKSHAIFSNLIERIEEITILSDYWSLLTIHNRACQCRSSFENSAYTFRKDCMIIIGLSVN